MCGLVNIPVAREMPKGIGGPKVVPSSRSGGYRSIIKILTAMSAQEINDKSDRTPEVLRK